MIKEKKIKLGDIITFFKLPNLKKSIKTEVIGLSKFKDFKTLYKVLSNSSHIFISKPSQPVS